MRIDVVTIFPRMVEGPLSDGIVQRAREKGLVELHVHDLRDHTDDRHRSVDDAPFGGGPGMVMKAEPFFRAVEAVRAQAPAGSEAVVLLSPRGRRFDQETARRLARLDRLVLLCGRYEGIDERVAEGIATEELSLGDFVLTGGETAADTRILVVRGKDGETLLPFADAFVRQVDLEGRRIVAVRPEYAVAD